MPAVPVLAAEAGDAAGDEDHESDGDAADDEEQLEVDLAVAAGEPVAALAAHVAAPADDALPVAVTKVALRLGRCRKRTKMDTFFGTGPMILTMIS